jgi:hypothetical protein
MRIKLPVSKALFGMSHPPHSDSDNYEKVQEFCRANGLTLSRNGHSVVWEKEWYQVFRFAEEQHAETFMKEFGGERMHPSERGKGKRWSTWKKGTYKPKPEAGMTSARRQSWCALFCL